jgi:hypothetical protein
VKKRLSNEVSFVEIALLFLEISHFFEKVRGFSAGHFHYLVYQQEVYFPAASGSV